MDEDYNMVYGIDKLADLLIERGIEFYVKDETSLFFADGSGNIHECWMAGAEKNLVNVMIVVTPEQAISVPDLNGIIAENAKLRELVRDVYKAAHMLCEAWDGSCSKEADGMSLHSVCPIGDTSELCVFGKLDDRMRELGVTE